MQVRSYHRSILLKFVYWYLGVFECIPKNDITGVLYELACKSQNCVKVLSRVFAGDIDDSFVAAAEQHLNEVIREILLKPIFQLCFTLGTLCRGS